MTGENNHFYGKKHSDETRKYISDFNTGRYDGVNNPFYGKKHSDETRKALSEINKGKHAGENNHFYGQTHTEETRKILSEKGKDRAANMSEEQKIIISEKMSRGQKRSMAADPLKYKNIKKRAGLISSKSPIRYKMNNLEKRVSEILEELGISIFFKYSVILGHKQYDFGCKEKRILLEVQGDYWHGNPELYNIDGRNGKRKLNFIQKKIIEKDKDKKIFADKHNLRLFYIWENEVYNGNIDVLEYIKQLL